MHPQEELEEKRRQKRIRITSLVIIGLMVLSAAGYYAGSDSGATQRYNGVKYTATPQGVMATIDGTRYGFNYFPEQVDDIPTDAGVAALLGSPILFLTYNSTSNYSDSMAAVQYYISELFNRQFGAYVAPAVMDNASYNLPLITCANSTANEPVIELTETNETRIALQDTCIAITVSSQEDLFRVQDKLVFMRLGVMQQ